MKQGYDLACRKLDGDYLFGRLGEFESLLDCLDSIGALDVPDPVDCSAWAVMSEDGFEVAAKRG